MTRNWISAARDRYIAANVETLRFVLSRPPLFDKWINTKLNSISLADYTSADGLRGPDYTYGWIQGRALEALVTHARYFEPIDTALADDLKARARALYDALLAAQSRDGHVYFLYNAEMTPILPDGSAQNPAGEVYTYSDAFAAKGLVAAAALFALPELDAHLAYLARVVASIAAEKFQMNEKLPLGGIALLTQPKDFGPRMILLGAGDMLKRFGLEAHCGFTAGFISHILDHHADDTTGLIRDVPGEDKCNIGHGIEFVGFALASLAPNAPASLIERLERVLLAEFEAGFKGPGVVLSVSAATGEVLDSKCPWWSLPETIRAASLAYSRTLSMDSLRVWQEADKAFFGSYWRQGTGVAYQTLTKEGPIDFVPATPDLDPGYHTGLSLLGAIRAADSL